MFNLSINTKFFLLFSLIIAMLLYATYRVLDHVYRDQIRMHAAAVADDVAHFGRWVAQYGRIWVTQDNNGYLSKKELVDLQALRAAGDDPGDPDALARHSIVYYAKNPALAQREFSEIAATSDGHPRFRMTSLNYMNPANKPDAFESSALQRLIREGGDFIERFDRDAGEYRYARKITMKPGCITCHGDPKQAPADVIQRYGNERGFGFKAGDVAGIISVRLPLDGFGEMTRKYLGLPELLLVLGALLFALAAIEFRILKPLKKLARDARKASIGETGELDIGKTSERSRDEIKQLGHAIQRLHTSMRIAIEEMRKKEQDSKPSKGGRKR